MDLAIFIGAFLLMVGATALILRQFWKAGWLTFKLPWKKD